MVTYTVEYSTDGGSSWNTINKYRNFEIKNGIGRNLLAPIGKVWTNVNTSASRDDILRIQIDSTTRFEGYIKDNGKLKENGVKVLEARGYGYEIMDEVVSLNLENVSPETVLENALDATTNSDYTATNLTTPTATNITLDTYDVEQKVRKIFKEMMSRAGYIIRFFPDKTVNFENFENGGSLGTVDEFKLSDYTEDDKDTVVNKVKVYGTYDNNVYTGTASDFTYVDDVKQENYNVRYVYSDAEAQNLADKRLRPEPSDTGTLIFFGSDFHADNIANHTFDFTSDAYNLGTKTVVVEKQIIREEHNEVRVGRGSDYGMFENGLKTFSDEDKNEPGNVWSDVYDDGEKPDDGATENKIFRQPGEPSGQGEQAGDLWVDTDAGGSSGEPYEIYEYDGSSWNKTSVGYSQGLIIDDSTSTALDSWQSSADVTAIDGGSIYTGSVTTDEIRFNESQPSSLDDGMLWYRSPDLYFRANGTTYSVDKTASQPADTLHPTGITSSITKDPTPEFNVEKTPDDNTVANQVYAQVYNKLTTDEDNWEVRLSSEKSDGTTYVQDFLREEINIVNGDLDYEIIQRTLKVIVPKGGTYEIEDVVDDSGNAQCTNITEVPLETK